MEMIAMHAGQIAATELNILIYIFILIFFIIFIHATNFEAGGVDCVVPLVIEVTI